MSDEQRSLPQAGDKVFCESCEQVAKVKAFSQFNRNKYEYILDCGHQVPVAYKITEPEPDPNPAD